MKIKYLGTGGGAGIPEMFCNCRICENARRIQGNELRSRPLALVDDELCIDLPCDARDSFLRHNADAQQIRWLFITHNHYDHFLAENLISRPEGCKYPLDVYISRASGKEIAEKIAMIKNAPKTAMRPIRCPNVHFLEPYSEVCCGKYSVIPLVANHARSLDTMNFIVSDSNRSILWLHDTGTLLEETFEFLQTSKRYFDFISMDCALPRNWDNYNEHMNIINCGRTAQMLRGIGCLDDNSMIFLSHIGHLVDRTHAELCDEAKEFGFNVAFDGEEIIF